MVNAAYFSQNFNTRADISKCSDFSAYKVRTILPIFFVLFLTKQMPETLAAGEGGFSCYLGVEKRNGSLPLGLQPSSFLAWTTTCHAVHYISGIADMQKLKLKSRIRETKNLSSDAVSRTDTILKRLRDLSKKKIKEKN